MRAGLREAIAQAGWGCDVGHGVATWARKLTGKSVLGILRWRSRLTDGCQADTVHSPVHTIHVWGASWLSKALLLDIEQFHLGFHLSLLRANCLDLLGFEVSL